MGCCITDLLCSLLFNLLKLVAKNSLSEDLRLEIYLGNSSTTGLCGAVCYIC